MKVLNLKNSFIIFLFISGLFFVKISSAQNKKAEIIGAYIYNFAKHTEINKCQSFDTYNIVLISENAKVASEFRKVVTRGKIKDKPVYINIHNNADVNLNDACIIFIAEDKSELYSEIYEKTKGKQVLLVTENYYDKREIMLNLIKTKDGRITFEINKANIYERSINISDEMLLSGGNEVDIIKLYLQSKKDLKKIEDSLKNIKSEIKKLSSQFIETQEKTNLQQNRIKEQIMLIEDHKKVQIVLLAEINEQKRNIDIHRNLINKQKGLLSIEKDKLSGLKDSLNNSKIILGIQEKELNEGMHRLKVLKDEIRIKSREVRVQETTLGEQYDTITKQRHINNLFIIIIILVIALTITTLTYGVQRKKKNKKLHEQNEELTSIIEQLKNTQQQLIQSEKMASLGILTAGIAHEINNPINFVYTGINSLQKDFKDIEAIINIIKDLEPDDKDLKEKILQIKKLKKEHYFDDAFEAMPQTIRDINTGAIRTAEIIAGLRKFSRMDENKFILSDIHEYLQTALLMLKNKFKDKININRNYYDKLPKIYCNPGKVTQVFMNIISNSIDAINEGQTTNGEIIITTIYEDNNVEISIKDNGTGIKKDTKEKMFDPFFTTKDVGKGTGLGLAISYGIIKEHKGEIKVLSEIEIGTEIIIILPLKQ